MRWLGLRPRIMIAVIAAVVAACWVLTVATTGWAEQNRVDQLGQQALGQADRDLAWVEASVVADPSATRFEELGRNRPEVSEPPTEAVLIPIASAADGIQVQRAHQYAYAERLIPLAEREPNCLVPPTFTKVDDLQLARMTSSSGYFRCGHFVVGWALGRTSELYAVQYWLVLRVLDLDNATTAVPDLSETLVTYSVYISLGALAVAGLLAAMVARPLARSRAMAEAVAAGQLDQRVPVHGHDEVGRLSAAVNTMADRLTGKIAELERVNESQRRFVSDVAHELRTPTAALLASAEALEHPGTRDEAAALVAPQLRRLSALTEDLLEMSRLDAGRAEVLRSRIDLIDLVNEVIDDCAASPDVHLVGTFPLEVSTDPARVRVILRNLVANSLQHGAPPVTIEVERQDGVVTVSVRDGGPGVPPDLRDHVFDRFVRGDASRHGPSSGLGLAIAAQNAHLLGGSLSLVADGRTFRLDLPTGPDR